MVPGVPEVNERWRRAEPRMSARRPPVAIASFASHHRGEGEEATMAKKKGKKKGKKKDKKKKGKKKK